MAHYRLDSEQLETLRRPINGDGGFQTLLRRVRSGVDFGNSRVEISDEDWQKLESYGTSYGGGGFQERILNAILSATKED